MSEHGWYVEGRKLVRELAELWLDPQKLHGYLATVINQYKSVDDDERQQFLEGVQTEIDEFIEGLDT